MMTETARVIATEGEYAWVETQRKTACGSCSVQKGCGTGVLAKVLGNRASRIRVINTIGAESGELVVLGLEHGALVRSSFAVYAMPLVFLLLGGIGGGLLADGFSWQSRDGATAVCGAVGFLLGLAWVRRYSHAVALDPRHQPSLIGFADAPEASHRILAEDIVRDYRRKI